METAPKDGTVIVVYAEWHPKVGIQPDVFHAFYQESEGHWNAVAEDVPFRTPFLRELAVLLGWIEVPDSSRLAGTKA